MRNASLLFVLLVVPVALAACTAVKPLPLRARPPAPAAALNAPASAEPSGIELVWRTSLGDVINWMPQMLTTAAGDLLVIAASEAGQMVALVPASGAVIWRFTPQGQFWSDSVTVLGDAVFVGSEGATVTLLDGATGEVRWQRNIQPAPGEPLPGLESRAQPTLADGVIYVPTAGVGSRATVVNPAIHAPLIALRFDTGDELWRFTSNGYILRAPFVALNTQTLYVGGNYLADTDVDEGGGLHIYALDPADGSVRWTSASHDGLIKALWADEQVLAYVAYRDFLVGLDAASGAEVYRHNTGNWVQGFTVFPQFPGSAALPGLAYGSANAFLNVVDPATGEFIWRYNVEGTFNYPIGNAVLAGDTVYFISQRGDLHALNAATGALRWRQATGLETRDGIAVGAGHIYIGSVDGAVYGFRLH